jgi:hypothetical protein
MLQHIPGANVWALQQQAACFGCGGFGLRQPGRGGGFVLRVSLAELQVDKAAAML